MQTRDFHLGDILSVTTGILLSSVDGMEDLLYFMTGDDVFPHQWGRVIDEMAPRLLAQHPDLAAIDASAVTPKNYHAWLAEKIAIYGETRPVTSEPQFHEFKDPLSEAIEMRGPKVLIVKR